YCFFFQAEDGIRDFHVTGVQTCALPIITYSVRTVRLCGGGTMHRIIPIWLRFHITAILPMGASLHRSQLTLSPYSPCVSLCWRMIHWARRLVQPTLQSIRCRCAC